MEIVKIPNMKKVEYDRLISEEYVSRIVFKGEKYPYVAPFLYIFDGNYMYFFSTKYGKKIEYFKQNPYVSVEVEKFSRDLSNYAFVTLSGRLVEVKDSGEKKAIRDNFVRMIEDKKLSKNIMVALGHSPDDPIETIGSEERNLIWKLVDVKKITGFKDGT
ncbi:pyridoxamine 5'-phosphate oxidase family protein [Candidatus Methanoperedens nitratireducens]|uniref:Flavin-nucleotide-binding protein n=1 Tax=Candidatus Methanoperedens nitratireducens TaxID=1392998 RepID=A0A284VSF1_9EURY|nr:pyridoxamine 5'-phosphate oxidase family protein [Candidatus Methanoperedens nitroreducens]SNQ62206.1 conserved hypothetical protein [Candidatus Methanoperedens nitroreducens]